MRFLCTGKDEHLLRDNRVGWRLSFQLLEPKPVGGDAAPVLAWTVDDRNVADRYRVGGYYTAELEPAND